MVIFTKKFGTLDPHLPIVWDKVPKKRFFLTPSLISNRRQILTLRGVYLFKILGRVYLYLKQKIGCGRELIFYIECKMQNLKISKLERKNCKQCESVCGISS